MLETSSDEFQQIVRFVGILNLYSLLVSVK